MLKQYSIHMVRLLHKETKHDMIPFHSVFVVHICIYSRIIDARDVNDEWREDAGCTFDVMAGRIHSSLSEE